METGEMPRVLRALVNIVFLAVIGALVLLRLPPRDYQDYVVLWARDGQLILISHEAIFRMSLILLALSLAWRGIKMDETVTKEAEEAVNATLSKQHR